MKNMDKARLIVDRLNEKGAGLGNASWGIVEQALAEIDAADPYMPTDAEWQARLGMTWAATNTDGDMWLYSKTPSDANEHSWRGSDDWFDKAFVKQVTPPEDFHTTLRYRPAHLFFRNIPRR